MIETPLFNAISVVALIIGVIALIRFFILCSNVAAIRRRFNSDYYDQYQQHMAFGDQPEAIKALKNHLWSQYQSALKEQGETSLEYTKKKLFDQYSDKCAELGITYPPSLLPEKT